MFELIYYPLIDMESSGVCKAPMFPCKDRDIIEKHHSTYLEEFLPRRFRLHNKENSNVNFNVRCPYCGKQLHCISPTDEYMPTALYSCDCKEQKKI